MNREDKKRDINEKINIIRELLNKKIEEDLDSKEIQHVSEILDKLIVEYLKE